MARLGLFAVVAAAAVVMAGLVVAYDTLIRALETGLPPDVARYEVAQDRWLLLMLAAGGVAGIALGGLATWTRRLYRNVPALGMKNPRFAAGWAFAGWFVPLVAWFRPAQILADVWRAADFHDAESGDDWRARPAPRWIAAWWVMLIVTSGVAAAGFTLDRMADPFVWAVVSGLGLVLVAASALAGTAVVRRLTDHQEAAAWFTFGASPRFGSERRDVAVVVAAVTTAVAAGVAGFLAWTGPSASTDVAASAVDTGLHYSGFGVSFDYPERLTAVETPVIAGEISDTVGAVFAYSDDQTEYAAVSWVIAAPEYSRAELWTLLDGGVQGMEAEGADVIAHGDSTVVVRGQTYVVREFSGSGMGETFEGVMGATNCQGSNRAIVVVALSDGALTETRTLFEGIVDTARC